MKKIKWGIIAPGKIAELFAETLQQVEFAECYAVASRDIDRADSFSQRFGFTKSYGDYQSLLDDDEVDVVYIASPHTFHAEQSIACLKAGKATLCEKPMTVNVSQAKSVIDAAKENNCFYMEAIWSRFNPVYSKIQEWIEQGLIGDVNMVQASFGFYRDGIEDGRLYNPLLAGGATLDVGIYPITFSQMIYNDKPIEVVASGHVGDSKVDERVGIVLKYPQGKMAILGAAVSAQTAYDGWIYGTKGKIHLEPRFWRTERATLITDDDEQSIYIPHRVNGYEYEIEEVHKCLMAGQIESSVVPWQESLNVMAIMDQVRSQLDLVYPFEKS